MSHVKNLAQSLEESASKFSAKSCIIYKNDIYTYSEINSLVNKAGNAFIKLGIKKGDRVLISLFNCPEFVIAFYALAKIGAISVPINYLLSTNEEKVIIEDCEPSLIITSLSKIESFDNVRSKDTSIIAIEKEKTKELGVLNFWDLISRELDILSSCYCTKDDVVTILYTSGTTGVPKGVMLTHHSVMFCSSFYTNNDDMVDDYGSAYSENSVMVCALPFYHCYGQNMTLVTPISVGGTLIIIERFNTEEVLNAITKYRANMFAGVPTMYAYLANSYDSKKHDLSSLRFCCSAGAGLPYETWKGFKEKTGCDIIEGYGITEASAQAISPPLRPDKRKIKVGSVGLPLRNNKVKTEAKIVDDDGNELRINEIGELIIKGDHVMKGYWNMPKETEKTIRNGWLHTGDMAKKDEDGYIYIVDRKKDLIIVGGENVVPREVEEVLYQNPKVLEAAVIGEPDAVKGEVVKAMVVLKRGCHVTEEELIEFCSQRLAKFKVPKIVEFKNDLPKSSTGKILRKLLRK